MIKLKRVDENPILKPSDNLWENLLVFNPGAIVKDNMAYLIYRATGKNDNISRFGLATSYDGIHFKRFNEPLYSGNGWEFETFGIEDPRVVCIDKTYYLSYTAVSEDLEAEINPGWRDQIVKIPHIALSSTRDFKNFVNYGIIIPNFIGKDSSLFPRKINGKFALLYRTGDGKTFFSMSSVVTAWQEKTFVFEQRPNSWDSFRTGIGAPPIETEKGWLLFYHGVDDKNVYRLGIMFLDIDDPTKVLYRSPEPVFEPETDYEKYGFIPNVVFTCGAIERDGQYYVYYGAADQTIGVATIEKEKVLSLF